MNEDKLSIKDVFQLAIKGWKKEDIIDLVQTANSLMHENNEVVAVVEEEQHVQDEPEIDYKKLYEDTQQKLKEAQYANVSQSVVETPKKEVDLKSIFANL